MSERNPDKAIDFMIENAPKYAEAKAERIQIEQFMKSKKALLMQESSAKTVSEREAYAYAHQEYRDLIDGLGEAVKEEETLKWRLTAAELVVDVWRTRSANNRMQDRSTQ